MGLKFLVSVFITIRPFVQTAEIVAFVFVKDKMYTGQSCDSIIIHEKILLRNRQEEL